MRNVVLVFILLSLSAFAWGKKGAVVQVTLSPAGSFTIQSGSIKGNIQKNEDGPFTAKELYVLVSSLKTGIEVRDQHMKEKLEYKKYPKILLINVSGKDGKGKGTMVIRGVKKDIQFNYEEYGRRRIKGEFKLNLKDFGISGINYRNTIGVKDEVSVEAYVRK